MADSNQHTSDNGQRTECAGAYAPRDTSVSPPPTSVWLRPDEDKVGGWVKPPPPNIVQQVDQIPLHSVVTEEERGRLAVVGYILCPRGKNVPVIKELSGGDD